MRLYEILSPLDYPDFKQWFGDSKVVDKHGNPLRMYHGTSNDFEVFHPLSHFGTSRAANHRLRTRNWMSVTDPDIDSWYDNAHIKPVYLCIENPLRVLDMEASDEASLLNAIAGGKYQELDVNTARRQGIRRALRDAGYDGLVYRNRIEDRGKNSWVILDPDQVRSAIVS